MSCSLEEKCTRNINCVNFCSIDTMRIKTQQWAITTTIIIKVIAQTDYWDPSSNQSTTQLDAYGGWLIRWCLRRLDLICETKFACWHIAYCSTGSAYKLYTLFVLARGMVLNVKLGGHLKLLLKTNQPEGHRLIFQNFGITWFKVNNGSNNDFYILASRKSLFNA